MAAGGSGGGGGGGAAGPVPSGGAAAGGAGASAAGAAPAGLDGMRLLPEWNVTTGAEAAAHVATTFAGRTLFGIGITATDPDEHPRHVLSEAEKIALRRRKAVSAGQKLQAGLERERTRMDVVAAEVRSIIDDAKRRIDTTAQRQALAVRVARQAMEAGAGGAFGGAGGGLPPSRPATAGATRPGTARSGYLSRPGTAAAGDSRPSFNAAVIAHAAPSTLFLDASPLADARDAKRAPTFTERLHRAVDDGRTAATAVNYRAQMS